MAERTHRLPPQLRAMRAAFVFLTRVPVGGFPYSRDDWQWATGWFPFVGLVLGAGYALLWLLAAPALGPSVAAVLVVGASMMATGGFHEDGLADTADAMGGAYERQRLLEILKDSRVGAFGAMALFVVLALRVTLLASLGPAAPLALVLTECLSRVPPIWLMRLLPYVTSDDTAKSKLVARGRTEQVVLASVWPVLVMVATFLVGPLGFRQALVLVVTAAAVGFVTGWRYRARVGGITGDFLGATQQVGVCALLMAFAATAGR